MTENPACVGRFDDDVAAMRCHHQAGLCGVAQDRQAQGSNPSTWAAQMKSLIEMPPTEWVLKRTVQRL
jgi:hypothetical protein